MDEWYYPIYKHQYHVGVSDRTKEIVECDEVVYNGVDTSKFFPVTDINVKPYNALFLFRGYLPETLYLACDILGIGLHHGQTETDVASLINKVDFVIGYGRSVYEGMSCGRPALIYGDNGCDGWVNEWNFTELLTRNCSGWYTECQYDIEGLVDVLKKYNFRHGKTNRKLIEKHLSLEVMGDRYDEIIRRVADEYDERYDTGKVRRVENHLSYSGYTYPKRKTT
jgi:glycosyltransferase involved in cell wall biosynthesis